MAKKIYKATVCTVCIISMVMTILSVFQIAIIVKQYPVYWTFWLTALLSALLIPEHRKKKLKITIGVLAICCLSLPFTAFGLGSNEKFTAYTASNGDAIIIVESNTPVLDGFTVYRRLFGFVYLSEDGDSTEPGYRPFSSGDAEILETEDSLIIRYKNSFGTEYVEMKISLSGTRKRAHTVSTYHNRLTYMSFDSGS